MYHPTLVTWILIFAGLFTCVPLLIAKVFILMEPDGKRAKDILIGKDEEWRDNTHFKSAFGLAVTDWLVFMPFLTTGITGMILGRYWGYLFFAVSGAIQVYINVFLWFFEKEYVYAPNGPLKYFTYLWGNFIYWGVASLLYGVIRLGGYAI